MELLKGSNVLVISENFELRTALAKKISQLRYGTFESSSLEESKKYIENNKIKSIFIDASLLRRKELFIVKNARPDLNFIVFDRGPSLVESKDEHYQFCKLEFISDSKKNSQCMITQALRVHKQPLKKELEKMGFSSKQVQVLELVAHGKTNKTIGIAVKLSEQGVKYHIGVLLKSFSVINRRELQVRLQEI